MKLDEWKKKKIADIEETYKKLQPFNPEMILDEFFDKVSVKTTPITFPYDLATSISAQLEGTGKREKYCLNFYAWIGPMHAYHSFDIETDEQNEAMIALLKKTDDAVRARIVVALQKELTDLLKHMQGKDKYTKWRMQDPGLKGKIDRVKKAITELSEGIPSS